MIVTVSQPGKTLVDYNMVFPIFLDGESGAIGSLSASIRSARERLLGK